MANNIALIEKYLQNTIDTVFAEESKTKVLENGGKFIDLNFKEAGYVKIMSLLTDGLSDYHRVNNGIEGEGYTAYPTKDGYQVGSLQAQWELFKLSYDRGKQFRIDSMDNEETAGLVMANTLTEFTRTKLVPEVDACRFSKLASVCSKTLGNYVEEKISDNAIIKNFNNAFEWLTEHEVPSEEQVIFVSPAVMTLIRNTDELYKKLSQTEYKGDVSFTIDTYEGRPIIVVPSSRFFTNVKVGDNGYYYGADSKVINYIICSKKAIVPIVKLNKTKVWTPDSIRDWDGYAVNIRIYHDSLVPQNKIPGVYTSVSNTTASSKTKLLSVGLSTADGTNYSLDEFYTTPAGLLGRVVVSSKALTIGEKVTLGTDAKVIVKGETFTKFGSEAKEYFALIDGNDKAVALSGEITLPSKGE